MRYCAVVNSHSSYKDVLEIFLLCYRKHMWNVPLFICTDIASDFPVDGREYLVQYHGKTFRDQGLYCLKKIPFNYILTFNDDYFLRATPDYLELDRCVEILDSTNYDQIRFVRGPNFTRFSPFDALFELDNSKPHFFSQTLTMWKRTSLINIYKGTQPSGIARKQREVQFEVLANETARILEQKGLVYYRNESKKGFYHYDCTIIPHMISAVVDGKWNISEYSLELAELFASNNIKSLRPIGSPNRMLQRVPRIQRALSRVINEVTKRLVSRDS